MVKRGYFNGLVNVQLLYAPPPNASASPVVKQEYIRPWEEAFVNYGMQPFRNTSFPSNSGRYSFFPTVPKWLVSTSKIPFKICRNTRILGLIAKEKLITYPLSVNFY